MSKIEIKNVYKIFGNTPLEVLPLVKEGATVGLANGILSADGKIIYSAENLKVGLFKQ